jgi:hypothetical protein
LSGKLFAFLKDFLLEVWKKETTSTAGKANIIFCGFFCAYAFASFSKSLVVEIIATVLNRPPDPMSGAASLIVFALLILFAMWCVNSLVVSD